MKGTNKTVQSEIKKIYPRMFVRNSYAIDNTCEYDKETVFNKSEEVFETWKKTIEIIPNIKIVFISTFSVTGGMFVLWMFWIKTPVLGYILVILNFIALTVLTVVGFFIITHFDN